MTVLSVAVGIALVVLVGWDIFLTILHPSARGPLSYVANRATWALIRDLTTGLRLRRLLPWAGPLAMGVNVLVWVVGLWLGYALIYLPYVEGLSYDQPESFGAKGLTEALYVSGVALTTVGFGDIVAATDPLRLVTILESWSGLVAITAAITYVISVYPLVSSIRGSALRLSDLEASAPRGAARLLATGGDGELGDLQRALIETHENIRRFPVIYYFHAPTVAESVETLLRSSILVYLVSHWVRKPDGGGARHYESALRTTLLRIMDDFEADYIGGRATGFGDPPPLDREEARKRLHPLHEAAVEADPEAGGEREDELAEELAGFLARAEAFLSRLASENRAEPEPLVAGDAAPE